MPALRLAPGTNTLSKTFRPFFHSQTHLIVAFTLGLIFLFLPARSLRSDNFIFYFPKERRVVPLELIGSTNYLAVLEVLNLVGQVGGWEEKQNGLSVAFGNAQLELKRDGKDVKVNNIVRTLSSPVRVSNGQWMVPVEFLSSVLRQLIHERVGYQAGAKRVFIGEVKPNGFAARLEPLPDGARLSVQFKNPVTLRATSEGSKWIVLLGDQPVEPPEQTLRFQNPYVSQLQFDDQDGVPKLIVTPAATGLNFDPKLASGGKTLLADVLKPASSPVEPSPKFEEPAAEAVRPAQPALPTVVLDAGHGGQDSGAHSHDGVLEKNLVWQIQERVRLALLATKKYRVVLTRAADTDPTFDERAEAANTARPVAFLSLHAGNFGNKIPRLVVYTYQSPSWAAASAGSDSAMGEIESRPEDSRGIFVPWREIQNSHLERSQQLAQALQSQLGKIPGASADKPVHAPVRVLRSVDAPAAAIEIGSLAPGVDSQSLATPVLEEQIAAAIVRALDAFRGGQS